MSCLIDSEQTYWHLFSFANLASLDEKGADGSELGHNCFE